MKARYLTKSRFKLALECPAKLFYTRKAEYTNQKLEDDFLQSLAEGGFQVEELARLYFPNGNAITGNDWNYDLVAQQTEELLVKDNVAIYESAFKYQNLFIRADILVKNGNNVDLIEVKSKSFDANDPYSFLGKKGGIKSGWKAYLFDVAFQKYVIQKCHPDWNIKSFLLLADKNKACTITGLNQKFKISKGAQNRTGIKVESGLTKEQLGEELLIKVPIEDIIQGILEGTHRHEHWVSFEDLVQHFSHHYKLNKKIKTTVSSVCKKCEFRATPQQEKEGLKSGFKECMKEQLNWSYEQMQKPNIFEIADFKRANILIRAGKYLMEDLIEEDVNLTVVPGSISHSERHWLQIKKAVNNDSSPHFELESLREELSSWKFPLNFIDFETSTAALPLYHGIRPYEQVAFQFSHHIVYEDGRVEHHSEYINAAPGFFPNFEFIQKLKESLSVNQGSIFRYSIHENTIVNAIYRQLENSDVANKKELQEFIQLISQSVGNSTTIWKGERNMIDLCETVKDFYYDPYTKGSNSIKWVLPAVLHSSNYLQGKYCKPISDLQLSTTNFDYDYRFLQIEDGNVINPYKNLPPIFEGWTEEQLEGLVSEMESLNNGGLAMTAYCKLQYVEMEEEERNQICKALLKYCELDTLAMVMIYEYFREVVG